MKVFVDVRVPHHTEAALCLLAVVIIGCRLGGIDQGVLIGPVHPGVITVLPGEVTGIVMDTEVVPLEGMGDLHLLEMDEIIVVLLHQAMNAAEVHIERALLLGITVQGEVTVLNLAMSIAVFRHHVVLQQLTVN